MSDTMIVGFDLLRDRYCLLANYKRRENS